MSLRLSRFVGHRGIAAEAPENTLTGFRLAAEAGFSWVEFDVMLSADDVPVLHHDEELGRTDNGSGPVAAHPLSALKALDAGSWFGPGFAGERIPTFEETIACCRALGLSMNVEIKPTTGREVRTAELVSDMLNDLGTDLTDRDHCLQLCAGLFADRTRKSPGFSPRLSVRHDGRGLACGSQGPWLFFSPSEPCLPGRRFSYGNP